MTRLAAIAAPTMWSIRSSAQHGVVELDLDAVGLFRL